MAHVAGQLGRRGGHPVAQLHQNNPLHERDLVPVELSLDPRGHQVARPADQVTDAAAYGVVFGGIEVGHFAASAITASAVIWARRLKASRRTGERFFKDAVRASTRRWP